MDLLAFVLCSIVVGAASIGSVQASVFSYEHDPFTEYPNGTYVYYGGSKSIIASTHDPYFISFENITFWRLKEAVDMHSSMEKKTGLIQAFIYDDRYLAMLEGCKQGEVFTIPYYMDLNAPIVLNTYFYGNSLSIEMEHHQVNITKTGLYNLLFIFCDPKLRGTVINGTTLWRNSGSYFSGASVPPLIFYGWMLLAYVQLFIFRTRQMNRFWINGPTLVQYRISEAIQIGLIGMICKFLKYLSFNTTWIMTLEFSAFSVASEISSRTVAVVLVYTICMYYDARRHSWRILKDSIAIVVVSVFLGSLLAKDEFGNVFISNSIKPVVLLLPVIFLYSIAWFWMKRTMKKFEAQRMHVMPPETRRKFVLAVDAYMFTSIAWFGFEYLATVMFGSNSLWLSEYLSTVFWQVFEFALLCVVCNLFAPSEDSGILSKEGQELFASYDEVHKNFDAMGDQDNLLSGIDACDNRRDSTIVDVRSEVERCIEPAFGPSLAKEHQNL